ncbi:MAG: divergent PAP2 family protein [Chloroflexota bacterium]|nr:divergent PAP2 family protein [Chloroflexota bacterium]
MSDLLANRVLMVPGAAWLVAQMLKVLVSLFTEHRINLRLLVSAGGMPSSHSTLVAGLATAVAIQHGVGSSLFAIVLVFATIVMYDAAGVRRAVGIQAQLLNQMIEELFAGHPISETHLRELIGHTPFQVIMGAALGIGLVWLWM